ncbi:hypothetical protein CCACVL1_24972 [Corchorus capsularis]|uniref:Uncharacterized protein n=1 Tax=Corchorus capsularis TaxID=210143 RepID=A0A1R3GMI0_COCAP|nr:hypothetical protein CCACVL1_24972 [Corchorus capsularis]
MISWDSVFGFAKRSYRRAVDGFSSLYGSIRSAFWKAVDGFRSLLGSIRRVFWKAVDFLRSVYRDLSGLFWGAVDGVRCGYGHVSEAYWEEVVESLLKLFRRAVDNYAKREGLSSYPPWVGAAAYIIRVVKRNLSLDDLIFALLAQWED